MLYRFDKFFYIFKGVESAHEEQFHRSATIPLGGRRKNRKLNGIGNNLDG